MVKRAGVRHRRDTSELRTQPGLDGFVADTYTAAYVTGKGGNFVQFMLLYEDGRGERVIGRGMVAVVDISNDKVVVALDADARSAGKSPLSSAFMRTRSHGNPALAAGMRRALGSTPVPAGRIRVRGNGTDITLDNGAWSGTRSAYSRTRGEEVVCTWIQILHCASVCAVATGFLGTLVCALLCALTWHIVCEVIWVEDSGE